MATAGAEAPASAVVSPVEATPSVAGAWPDFAVVCSFLERYGALLDLPELTFPELEVALEETGAVPKPLMELHLKLMRKIGKSVTVERWEKYMIKICQDYNSTWAWEMEEKGYQEMSVECKVGLLKHLCECQFDDNLKFKNIINEEDGDAMRLQPIGRDKDGLMYWFQLDQEHNIRMYIEEQDDQDGSTWKCIVKFDEFDEAIDEAIEDDIRDGDGGGGGGRGKDMSNITGHRGKDISTILEGEKIETKRPQRTVSRRKKRRRLNDLDSDSKEEEESEDDEFKISEGSQDEFVVSNEDVEESEEDQQSNDSDFGVRRPRRHYRRPVRKSRRLKRRKRKYSDDDEEEDSEEEEQEESETDASSDYSDDYLDMRRRRSRRNQKRQVNYKEDSESDGSQKGARYGRGKEMRRILKRRFSSSESNESGTEKRRPGRGRPPLLRKRIRSSNDECSEDEKPVRKRLNRIETDEDEEDDTKVCEVEKPPTVDKPSATINLQESTKKPCYRIESDDDDFDNVGKDESPLDYSLVDLPSTNGQSPGKTIENLIGKPSDKSQTSKDTSANISQASNGTGSNPEAVVPEEDEDELLRVTDLVDYVCNSEQL
ncbi:remodeling and spacing factor 1 [Bombina bombina]|uniref:remodeling and spacing factor 1 n=1 Tax=Bombina bombina TaxID=8345 RepID=UPI00235A6CF2|nr:remodeling and spacing factor 1 [Bombina bombina]